MLRQQRRADSVINVTGVRPFEDKQKVMELMLDGYRRNQ